MSKEDKAIIGVKQYEALCDKADEIMRRDGYDQLNVNMLGLEIKLTYLLFRQDRVVGKIKLNDIYREMYGDRKEVKVKIKDENGEFTKDPDENLKDSKTNQSMMRDVFKEAFDYAVTVLEGNQEAIFIKKAGNVAKNYRNLDVTGLVSYLIMARDVKNSGIYGINLEAIGRAANEILEPNKPLNSEAIKILINLYEECRQLDYKNKREKITDTILIKWRDLTERLTGTPHGKIISITAKM